MCWKGSVSRATEDERGGNYRSVPIGRSLIWKMQGFQADDALCSRSEEGPVSCVGLFSRLDAYAHGSLIITIYSRFLDSRLDAPQPQNKSRKSVSRREHPCSFLTKNSIQAEKHQGNEETE